MSLHDDDSAIRLALWADTFVPSTDDLELAARSLRDTLAVTLAARGHALERLVLGLDDATKWTALGHVLDFDDVHMESTTHLSVVCVMATLAAGGGADAYLAGGGVMARLGRMLGWSHYEAGWHATCTAGAPAAAVAAGVAMKLDASTLATAMALAIPAAGGLQQAFGTDEKSLQVGFAVAAGLRAARLAAAGASADPRVLDAWIRAVAGEHAPLDVSGPAIPGGLAVKLFPCCYALQRPIVTARSLLGRGLEPSAIESLRVTTTAAALQPLIHHRPNTALEAKFSLEYAIAAAILDPHPGFASFTDEAVRRARARELVAAVEIVVEGNGTSILAGTTRIEATCRDGSIFAAELDVPPGAPSRPPSIAALEEKVRDCGADLPSLLSGVDWSNAAALLGSEFGHRGEREVTVLERGAVLA